MSAVQSRQRFWGLRGRFFLVVSVWATGVAVHWLLFVFISISIGDGPTELARTFDVGWVGEDPETSDDGWIDTALLFDAEPLFLPTQWNSASDLSKIARLRDATELFPPFAARVGKVSMDLFPEGSFAPDDWAFLPDSAQPFRHFLKAASVVTANETIAGVSVRIVSVPGLGNPIELNEVLQVDLKLAPPTLWNPLEYVLVIDPKLGTEMPLKLTSSGSVDWDNLLTKALSENPFLEQLPYGYYRVFVAE